MAAASTAARSRSACRPQFRNFRRTITTPQQTIQQIVDPPQTNIKSSSYTIAGVDPSQPAIGLVTPSLVSSGRFIAPEATNEALLADSYASRNRLKVGSTLDLNKTNFTVVGLVKPPLGGQTADVYIPLAAAPERSRARRRSTNVVLVRASSGTSVGAVQKEIQQLYPNAQVASAKDVADQISGSLVNASNLSHRLGIALEILAAAAAFLLAVLLTLSSVGKRVRELGTLKALGWTQWLVVRQVVGESLAQGIGGGLLGVALGILGALDRRRVRRDADRAQLDGRRVRLRRARPHGERHRDAQRPALDRGARARASCSRSSAA